MVIHVTYHKIDRDLGQQPSRDSLAIAGFCLTQLATHACHVSRQIPRLSRSLLFPSLPSVVPSVLKPALPCLALPDPGSRAPLWAAALPRRCHLEAAPKPPRAPPDARRGRETVESGLTQHLLGGGPPTSNQPAGSGLGGCGSVEDAAVSVSRRRQELPIR